MNQNINKCEFFFFLQIKNEGADMCLDVFGGGQEGHPGSLVSLAPCHGVGLGQVSEKRI